MIEEFQPSRATEMLLENSTRVELRLCLRLHSNEWKVTSSSTALIDVLDMKSDEAERGMNRDPKVDGIDRERDGEKNGIASREMVPFSFSDLVVPSNLAQIPTGASKSTKAVGDMAARGATMRGSSIGGSTRMGLS